MLPGAGVEDGLGGEFGGLVAECDGGAEVGVDAGEGGGCCQGGEEESGKVHFLWEGLNLEVKIWRLM